MPKKKLFNELSKCQKNKRIKRYLENLEKSIEQLPSEINDEINASSSGSNNLFLNANASNQNDQMEIDITNKNNNSFNSEDIDDTDNYHFEEFEFDERMPTKKDQSKSLRLQLSVTSPIKKLPDANSLTTRIKNLENKVNELTKIASAIYTILFKNDEVLNVEENNTINTINLQFPIELKKDLDDLEEKLKNPLMEMQYKRMIRQIGGESFEKHVRRALSLIFSDSLAYNMSWTGVKNTIMIKNKNYIYIVIEVIIERWSETDKASVEAIIKSWFQHAGDRIKSKSAKNSSVLPFKNNYTL